ncbi:MAG: hypothetical protein RQ847_03325 [Wenzhouxiangellaceae bacterium]|nr:hypothetical protein [Wenzhouxiangellaceae bacterium]
MKTAEIDRKGARVWVERWQHAESELDARRLSGLRALTEREAAERFAALLRLEGTYPLRPSSGLVEQQRVFDRLRQQR